MKQKQKDWLTSEFVLQTLQCLRAIAEATERISRDVHNLERRGVLIQLTHEQQELTNNKKILRSLIEQV